MLSLLSCFTEKLCLLSSSPFCSATTRISCCSRQLNPKKLMLSPGAALARRNCFLESFFFALAQIYVVCCTNSSAKADVLLVNSQIFSLSLTFALVFCPFPSASRVLTLAEDAVRRHEICLILRRRTDELLITCGSVLQYFSMERSKLFCCFSLKQMACQARGRRRSAAILDKRS